MIKFTISRKLHRDNDKIVEILEVNPKSKILSDDSRSISTFIQNIMSLFSMAHIFPLTSIVQDSPLIRIHELKYKNHKDVPDTYSEIKFNYIPNLGTKKCSECLNHRIMKDGSLLCHLRSKRIIGDYWKNCFFYTEKSKLRIEENDTTTRIK